ncbi:hypothetical protein GCM10007385_35250 [Tateyamaria omphalii]|uniref:hypothetical protein n=1 Tax=Tateyamaria omphalii TaxID=299262 RepID=UPI00167C1A56|nr:hypothetical protein [Tateyamaria omphalii]GGX63071.1 hypothetical protein GCM10007385_35250 [Tateyamaria omphalii]
MTAVFLVCLSFNWMGSCTLIARTEVRLRDAPSHCLLVVDPSMRNRIVSCSIEGEKSKPIPETEEGEPT